MSIIINPFIVSGKIPEAYFCDRVAESLELEKSLTNQLNVVLIHRSEGQVFDSF